MERLSRKIDIFLMNWKSTKEDSRLLSKEYARLVKLSTIVDKNKK